MDQNRHSEYLPHIYFAPMEGITTSIYREVHRKHFRGIDRYFTPFLAANHTHHLKKGSCVSSSHFRMIWYRR